MPVIIDQNGRREVTQQEYNAYMQTVQPTLDELKTYKIEELDVLTRKYISENIYFEIERSVRTSQPIPRWVNDFSDTIVRKNHDIKQQIENASTHEELMQIDINSITE
jgi:hypothetical protein